MTHKPSDGPGWSVVMTATGKLVDIEEINAITEQVLGRKGLDYYSLAFFRGEDLPAEIANGLSRQQADDFVAKFSRLSIVAEAVPTSEVTDVKHWAWEVWADHYVQSHYFTEVEGLILTMYPIAARRCLARHSAKRPDSAPWQAEWLLNHEDLVGPPYNDMTEDETIEIADQKASKLHDALCEAYPHRAFTVEYSTSIVAFWQTTPDSPHEEYLCAEEKTSYEQFCQKCYERRLFRVNSKVHPRLEKAKWGNCEECGTEAIVLDCSKLTFIEPRSKTRHER